MVKQLVSKDIEKYLKDSSLSLLLKSETLKIEKKYDQLSKGYEEMKSINNYGEIHSLLHEDEVYTVGTNDGKEFRRVVYKGTKLLNGKSMMVFKTEDNSRLTINPSFHTFTIEEQPLPQPEDFESKVDVHIQNQIKEK